MTRVQHPLFSAGSHAMVAVPPVYDVLPTLDFRSTIPRNIFKEVKQIGHYKENFLSYSLHFPSNFYLYTF